MVITTIARNGGIMPTTSIDLGDIITFFTLLIGMGAQQALARKNDNEGAAAITKAAIDLVNETKAELNKVRASQRAILEIQQIQSQEIQELWGEYEKLYAGASLMLMQLQSQGVSPSFHLPPKRNPPPVNPLYDLDAF